MPTSLSSADEGLATPHESNRPGRITGRVIREDRLRFSFSRIQERGIKSMGDAGLSVFVRAVRRHGKCRLALKVEPGFKQIRYLAPPVSPRSESVSHVSFEFTAF